MGTFLVLSFSLAEADSPMAALLMNRRKTASAHFANVLQLARLFKLALLLVDRHLGLSEGKCLAAHRAHPLLLLRDDFLWVFRIIVEMKLLHVMPQSAWILETSSTLFTGFSSLHVNFFTSITQVSVLECFVCLQ